MTGRTLLLFASLLEVGAGVALILNPAWVVRWLLGGELSGSGPALGRVAGFGLLSFGVACWPVGLPGISPVRGMLIYNALATAFFAYLLFANDEVGKLLLPALVLHALLTFLFVREWFKQERAKGGRQ
jgi:hypothetical protein